MQKTKEKKGKKTLIKNNTKKPKHKQLQTLTKKLNKNKSQLKITTKILTKNLDKGIQQKTQTKTIVTNCNMKQL